MKLSLVMIVEVGSVEQANALCLTSGWSEDNFTAHLSANGDDPVTHYGLRATAGEDFVENIQRALDADPALASTLIVDLREDAARWVHFDDVLAQAGLQRAGSPAFD